MNRINEYGIEPGVYQHHKGGLYVVVDLVTHVENYSIGKMEPLSDPLVVYHDLIAPVEEVNGKMSAVHRTYARKLSEFKAMVENNKKRFEKI